jgi:predicted AAA+ superfamily ATPase
MKENNREERIMPIALYNIQGEKMDNQYLPRIVDEKLALSLKAMGAVLIEGPKWCGKTSTGENIAKSVLYMQDPDEAEENMLKAKTKPSLLLEGDTPRLLDEWQVAPVLWNAVRFAVDKRKKSGQFILTGSVVPTRTDDMHTGTGRISRMKMRTMSLYESGESSGEISLKDLFDGKTDMTGRSKVTLEQLAFILTRGGWPASVNEKDEKIALMKVYDYLEAVVNEDISKIDGVEKNPDRVRALMRSISRNISTAASTTTVLNDLATNDERLSQVTIDQYITCLKKLFVVEELPAWSPHLRSKTAIRKAAKRHFTDPSIATASLGASSKRLMSELKTFGLLFESLVIRDLRVYADSRNGNVYHYRDAKGIEVDAIVQLHDGNWGAAEIKLGAGEIEEAAEKLIDFKNSIDTNITPEPAFLAVITATQSAFQLENGVWVVPLGCLKN